MTDAITVIREAERPVVDFVGGATYRAIIGDDTGEGLPIRTGIQTSPPGYQTRVHSHPYVETLTVIEGRGEAWLDGEPGVVALDGKTLRRSFDRAAGASPLHLVSAWAAEQRLVLGQVAVGDKSNEITAVPQLLKMLSLSGVVVTADWNPASAVTFITRGE